MYDPNVSFSPRTERSEESDKMKSDLFVKILVAYVDYHQINYESDFHYFRSFIQDLHVLQARSNSQDQLPQTLSLCSSISS